MNKHLLTTVSKQLYLYQSCFFAVIVIISALFWGIEIGLSVLLGALVWAIPSFYFTHRVFAATKDRSVAQMIKKFYIAEILKLLISALLIVLVLKIFSVVALAFFSGYIFVLFGFWIIAAIVLMRKHV